MTLDNAQETFETNPTLINAKLYRDVAIEYWEDEQIGDESLLASLEQIRAWKRKIGL